MSERELLDFLVYCTRLALLRKEQKVKEHYYISSRQNDEQFEKMYDFTKKFEIVQEKQSGLPKYIYLRIIIKVNDREDKLQLFGYDMRPIKNKRH